MVIDYRYILVKETSKKILNSKRQKRIKKLAQWLVVHGGM